jgi:hypothetical protein
MRAMDGTHYIWVSGYNERIHAREANFTQKCVRTLFERKAEGKGFPFKSMSIIPRRDRAGVLVFGCPSFRCRLRNRFSDILDLFRSRKST